MTPETNCTKFEIDHVKPIRMFDISKNEKAFIWKNAQPILKEVHPQKEIKVNFLDNQLQFFKAYQFIKLNEEVYNEDFH